MRNSSHKWGVVNRLIKTTLLLKKILSYFIDSEEDQSGPRMTMKWTDLYSTLDFLHSLSGKVL